MSLYNRCRPTKPAEILGNKTTVALLTKHLKSKDGFPQASLFSGSSGCGKTTIARIVARGGLQCTPTEFREFNSANFNGIDSIRGITQQCETRPMWGPVKVYLYDEAHQITKPAQEAMLKLLEDPQPWVYHMLCTTNPDKLITAVRNRLTEFKVNPLKTPEMKELLTRTAKAEGITISAEEINAIIAVADGSPRAALVALENVSLVEGAARMEAIGKADIEKSGWDLYISMKSSQWPKVVECLVATKEAGSDPEATRWCMLGIARTMLAKGADAHAARVISYFKFPFYDSREPGLYGAAFDVFTANNRRA